MMKKNDYTFGEWIWQWYKLYKKDKLAPDCQRNYERRFILHIPPELFNKRLIEVTALDIDLALYSLGSNSTAFYMYYVYYGAMKKAYQLRFIEFDEADIITRIRYRGNNSKALTDAEIVLLFDSFAKNDPLSWYYKFLLYTGCRKQEALNMRVSDIDFDNNIIHIRGTKTKNSDRYLPITKDLKELLNIIIVNKLPNDKLFYYCKNTFYSNFKRVLPNHKLHDLRHTFATRCAESGIHPAITQTLLGHSNPQFTLKVYTHIDTKKCLCDLEVMHEKLPL